MFPVMPAARGGNYAKGALILRSNAQGIVNCGASSENRWIIVVAAKFTSDVEPFFPLPQIDGVAMTLLEQDSSAFSSDGHVLGIWAKLAESGTSFNITLAASTSAFAVFTMTGVRNINAYATSNVSVLAKKTGAAVIGAFVCNFTPIASVAEMTMTPAGGAARIGYDESMSADSVNYLVSSPPVLQRKLAWEFDY